MKSALVSGQSQRTYVLIFSKGDEVSGGLSRFADENNLSAAHLTAIGAFERLTLGYFDWQKKDYSRIEINEQVEVASMNGDIALKDGKPKVHAHLVIAKSDGSAYGGHLLEAHVRPTLEVVIVESPANLQRTYDPETGLALIDIDASEKQKG